MAIVKRSSGIGGEKVPFQVQAQVLRERQAARNAATSGFVLPADDAAEGAQRALDPSHWRAADLKRAIAAAREAGLEDFRVEIGPDGTISLVVGGAGEPSPT